MGQSEGDLTQKFGKKKKNVHSRWGSTFLWKLEKMEGSFAWGTESLGKRQRKTLPGQGKLRAGREVKRQTMASGRRGKQAAGDQGFIKVSAPSF